MNNKASRTQTCVLFFYSIITLHIIHVHYSSRHLLQTHTLVFYSFIHSIHVHYSSRHLL